MMKEVEEGKKLRHVECNDRSQPIIQCKSMTKVENKFIFETENKDTKLNALLKEIQGGVKLKSCKRMTDLNQFWTDCGSLRDR